MADERFYASTFDTHLQELEFLRSLGFATNPLTYEADSLEDVWKHATSLMEKRSDLEYHIDGMVVKINDNILSGQLGVVGKTPRGWCAIKFPAQEVVTKIVGITWQVGRTGRVVPVAELEPVLLDGTVVKRATLHNYKEVVERGLVAGDSVIIRKAGDIIPEVVKHLPNLRPENAKNFEIAHVCPSCQTPLKKTQTDVDLYCPNEKNCKAQVIGRLSYYCQRNIGNIVGLSEKNLEKFMEEFGLKDISDLYDLPWAEIFELEGFGRKSVENMQESVSKSRKIADFKFLAGLSIEGVGPEIAKLICRKMEEKGLVENDDAFASANVLPEEPNKKESTEETSEGLF